MRIGDRTCSRHEYQTYLQKHPDAPLSEADIAVAVGALGARVMWLHDVECLSLRQAAQALEISPAWAGAVSRRAVRSFLLLATRTEVGSTRMRLTGGHLVEWAGR